MPIGFSDATGQIGSFSYNSAFDTRITRVPPSRTPPTPACERFRTACLTACVPLLRSAVWGLSSSGTENLGKEFPSGSARAEYLPTSVQKSYFMLSYSTPIVGYRSAEVSPWTDRLDPRRSTDLRRPPEILLLSQARQTSGPRLVTTQSPAECTLRREFR